MTRNTPFAEQQSPAHQPVPQPIRWGVLRRFWAQTSGAVTVDWVFLTASVVAMVIAFMAGFTADINGFLVDLMAGL